MITRLVLLTCLLSFAATASPAAAEDEPYTARVSTRTEVDVRQVVDSGTSFVAQVRVEANSPLQPTGKITVTVTRLTEQRDGRTAVSRSSVERSSTARGDLVWTTSVTYTGGEVTTRGPTLREVGRYQVTARFEPDVRSVFRGSQGGATIKVVPASDANGDDGNGGDNGGGQRPGQRLRRRLPARHRWPRLLGAAARPRARRHRQHPARRRTSPAPRAQLRLTEADGPGGVGQEPPWRVSTASR